MGGCRGRAVAGCPVFRCRFPLRFTGDGWVCGWPLLVRMRPADERFSPVDDLAVRLVEVRLLPGHGPGRFGLSRSPPVLAGLGIRGAGVPLVRG